MKGLIFDIRRFSVHDGPGIRTTVFMKGCPLSCWWCHNPESRNSACETYIEAHKLDGTEFRKEETVGKNIGAKELLVQIEKDLVFMNESAGGVTFSGGEPLFQPEFLVESLKLCHSAGIHTSIDTSGFASREIIERVLPFTQLFLYDLKLMNDSLHLNFTGVSNRQILENLKLISESGKNVWIRLPLIEDVNDQSENLQAVSDFLHSLPKKVGMVNILPFHTIGQSKYSKFGKENRMELMRNYPVEKSDAVLKYFIQQGFKAKLGG